MKTFDRHTLCISRIQGYLLVKIALLISPRDILKIYGILESPWCLTLRMSYAPSLGPLGLTKFVWQPSLISRSNLEQAHSRAPTNFHRYLGFTYFSHLILSLLVYKCCAISLPHFSASFADAEFLSCFRDGIYRQTADPNGRCVGRKEVS